MGLIKRNEFWFDRHYIYIKTYRITKKLERIELKKAKSSVMQL